MDIATAWARHADHPGAVFEEARAAVPGCPEEQAGALGGLLFHVGTEHLGRFDDVRAALEALKGRSADKSIRRALAALGLVSGDAGLAAQAEAEAAEIDPRIAAGMIRANAASVLAGRGDTSRAAPLFRE